jgi:flagellar basal-body rod modification protein FlgD
MASIDRLNDLGLSLQQTSTKKAQLGQEEFLKLMTTQLQNQDPFKPMESGEFLSQIAQFSTVSGIQSMQESLSGLATSLTSNQTLQGAQLVGHGVLVPASGGYLDETGGLAGSIDVPASGQVVVEVSDASGAVVGRYDLGDQAAGEVPFSWDGNNQAGERMPAGTYRINAMQVQGANSTSLTTYTTARVQSVSIGASGLTLNLQGLDSVPLSEVRQIL